MRWINLNNVYYYYVAKGTFLNYTSFTILRKKMKTLRTLKYSSIRLSPMINSIPSTFEIISVKKGRAKNKFVKFYATVVS